MFNLHVRVNSCRFNLRVDETLEIAQAIEHSFHWRSSSKCILYFGLMIICCTRRFLVLALRLRPSDQFVPDA